MGNRQGERAAGVVVPDLGGIDAMPVRALAARQQEVDRGRRRAAIAAISRIAKRLAKMATLRMRLEIEPRDDLGGTQARRRGHEKRFLRSRISPNTSAAGLPESPTLAATAGTSARRNTLAFFSSPINVG